MIRGLVKRSLLEFAYRIRGVFELCVYISEGRLQVLIQAERLQKFVEEIFIAAEVKPTIARIVAEHLVLANLKGHDSHGVGMVPTYVHGLKLGFLNPNASIETVHDKKSVVVLDGKSGFGQVVGIQATERLIELTRQRGLACVGLRNSYHLGRIGTYGELCAQAGLVSIHFVNVAGHEPNVAPWGGREARFHTNPFCCEVPREGKLPIVLDMATTTIAFGKVRVAHFAGQDVPNETLIDHTGQPTNRPDVMFTDPREVCCRLVNTKALAWPSCASC